MCAYVRSYDLDPTFDRSISSRIEQLKAAIATARDPPAAVLKVRQFDLAKAMDPSITMDLLTKARPVDESQVPEIAPLKFRGEEVEDKKVYDGDDEYESDDYASE